MDCSVQFGFNNIMLIFNTLKSIHYKHLFDDQMQKHWTKHALRPLPSLECSRIAPGEHL